MQASIAVLISIYIIKKKRNQSDFVSRNNEDSFLMDARLEDEFSSVQ